MSSPRTTKPNKPGIIADDDARCLDTIKLKELEDSYRGWATESPRRDVRISRKRILLIFLLIRYTGAKLNEILSLDIFRDIDQSGNMVLLRARQGKSAASEIPIPPSLSHEIRGMLSEPDFAGLIREKFAVDPGFVRRKFYDRADACGFDKKLGAPEMIRKARAVELLRGNMPLPAVQNLLGHATPNLAGSMVTFSEKEMRRLTQLFVEKEADRKTSARNSFFGKVSEIKSDAINAEVVMATMDGFTLRSTITNHSLGLLGLKKGRLLTAEVKAPWVTIHAGDSEPRGYSAENRLKGVVSKITRGEINTEYVVRVSDMTELCAVVTTQSSNRLDLKKGDQSWMLFNSFAVILRAE